jgi:hypothetical protein
MQGTLTPHGVCCSSGQVDECGVCDGLHNCPFTGKVTVRTLAVPHATGRRRLAGQNEAEERLQQGWAADVCLALGRYPSSCGGVHVEVLSASANSTQVCLWLSLFDIWRPKLRSRLCWDL